MVWSVGIMVPVVDDGMSYVEPDPIEVMEHSCQPDTVQVGGSYLKVWDIFTWLDRAHLNTSFSSYFVTILKVLQ